MTKPAPFLLALTAVLGAAFGAPALGATALAQDGQARPPVTEADRIVAEIERQTFPAFDALRAGDLTYMKQHSASREAVILAKRRLVERLWQVERTHPRMAEFMEIRWSEAHALAKTPEQADKVVQDTIAEIDAMFKANPGDAPETTIPEEVRRAAQYWRASSEIRLNGSRTAESLLAASKYADSEGADPTRAMMLFSQAAFAAAKPEDQAKAYRAAIDRYPDHPQTSLMRGLLRRLEAVGKPFPLEFLDALSGKTVNGESLSGKVVLIEFFSTTLAASRDRLVLLKVLQEQLGPEGLVVIGICMDKDLPATESGQAATSTDLARKWARENGASFPILATANPDEEWAIGWGVLGLPTTFILDRKGVLRFDGLRSNLKGDLEQLLKEGQ